MVEERARRIAANEAVFRQVNEQFEQLNDAFEAVTGTMTIVCECGNADCLRQFSVTRQEYEAIRADPTLFAIVPGHEEPDVEVLVDRRGAYDVVQKRPGVGQDVAEQTDPRAH